MSESLQSAAAAAVGEPDAFSDGGPLDAARGFKSYAEHSLSLGIDKELVIAALETAWDTMIAPINFQRIPDFFEKRLKDMLRAGIRPLVEQVYSMGS